MYETLKEAIKSQGVVRVDIVDDVFDDVPRAADLESACWDIFFADVEPEPTDVEALVSVALAGRSLSTDDVTLRGDEQLVEALWKARDKQKDIEKLFAPLTHARTTGQGLLQPLLNLLGELELNVRKLGTREPVFGAEPDCELVFVDLFLGNPPDENALKLSQARVKDLVEKRPEPPLVVLMSSSPELGSRAADFRDQAGVLGCQFRTLSKADILDRELLTATIHELVRSYQDARKLSLFIRSWQSALGNASQRLLAKLRRLDLRDYADIQQLVLESQGENVGSSVLETFDGFFHYELESESDLARAARSVNEIDWTHYPASQFLPDHTGAEITDGLMFHHSNYLDLGDALGFGDVVVVERGFAWTPGAGPEWNPHRNERQVLLLVTQACDLLHKDIRRLLFLSGVARPASLVNHFQTKDLITPVLRADAGEYFVEWNAGAPVAVSVVDVRDQLLAGNWKRWRRLRSLFALHIQHRFSTELSRVATPSLWPMRHRVGLRVDYQTLGGTVAQLLTLPSELNLAVALVGRTAKGARTDRLVLSHDARLKIRDAMKTLDVEKIDGRQRPKWVAVRDGTTIGSMLGDGVPYKNADHQDVALPTVGNVLRIYGAERKEPPDAKIQFDMNKGPLLLTVQHPEH